MNKRDSAKKGARAMGIDRSSAPSLFYALMAHHIEYIAPERPEVR